MRSLNTTLSRRSILKVAAPAAAALNVKTALSAVADLRPKPQPRPFEPFGVDLADPGMDAIWRNNLDGYHFGVAPELRVVGWLKSHCFGVVRGRSLRALLDCLTYRLEAK